MPTGEWLSPEEIRRAQETLHEPLNGAVYQIPMMEQRATMTAEEIRQVYGGTTGATFSHGFVDEAVTDLQGEMNKKYDEMWGSKFFQNLIPMDMETYWKKNRARLI